MGNTCSPEIKHLKRLQQQRVQARKRATARTKRRFRQTFHLAALDSKKNFSSSSKHGKPNESKASVVPQISIQGENHVHGKPKESKASVVPQISIQRENLVKPKADKLQLPSKPKAVMKSENRVKPKKGGLKRKSTYVL